MKTFKILTTVSASMLIFLLNTACKEDEDLKPLEKATSEVDYVSIDAILVADAYMPTNTPTTYLLCGNSAKCNIAGASPSMRISGQISPVSKSGEFSIKNGRLIICNEPTGCTLLTHFEGAGVANESGFKLNSMVEVDSGIGIFKAESGMLQLIVKGEKIPGMIDKMQYSITVYGNLNQPADIE